MSGQADQTASDFNAEINWGDSSTWDTGTLVYQGINGNFAEYEIEGSHVYQKTGTDIPIVLYVTGPDGTSVSSYPNDIDSANVAANPNAIALGSLSPTEWQQNKAGYDGTISVTGGTGGYQDLQVGGLPTGLSATIVSSVVNSQQSGTITISGTPTQSGQFNLSVSLKDGNGDTGSGKDTLTITAAPLTLGDLSPTQWQVNQPDYDGTISVSGGSGGYKNLAVGGLPAGLSASIVSSTVNGQQSGTITISGTPTKTGTFTLTTSLEAGNGASVSGSESLTITAVPITVGTLSPAEWEVNESGYDGKIAVAGGTGTYSGLAVSGLPAGLNAALSGSVITVSGTPTESGTFNTIKVTLKDSAGTSGSGTESLTIDPAMSLGDLIGIDLWETDDPAINDTPQDVEDTSAGPDVAAAQPMAVAAITTGTLSEPAYAGELYKGTITINGGTAPYTVSASGAPAGWKVSVSGSTITITGTPQWNSSSATGVIANLSFPLTITDSSAKKASLSKTYPLPVNSAVQDLLDNNANQLGNLQNGTLTPIGPPTADFNCFAYAANQSNPTAPGLGWVNPPTFNQLMSIYNSFGWYLYSTTEPSQVPSTGLVVIYENAQTSPTHAALVTTSGVFAKMGHLGTYKFSDINQMAGGGFGQPALWLAKTGTPIVTLSAGAARIMDSHSRQRPSLVRWVNRAALHWKMSR